MRLFEIILTGIGLSMDAFAVAVCKGLSVSKLRPKYYLITGLWFGGFQAMMPILGFWLGSTFSSYIEAYDHWVAFGLLAFIGIRMVREGVSKEEPDMGSSFDARSMSVLALATSIDALAVGVAFSLIPGFDVYAGAALIGVITFGLSALGLKIGNIFGAKYRSTAEIVGGVILVLLGLEILVEHLTSAAG